MCLFVDSKKVRVAKKDMVCYKILRKRENSLIFSLYMNFLYELKTLYKLNGRLKISTEYISGNTEFNVYEGFHVYIRAIDAFSEYDYLINKGCHYIGLYKCRIPKGANFIRGLFGNKPSIASDAIEILEEIR